MPAISKFEATSIRTACIQLYKLSFQEITAGTSSGNKC